MSACRASVTDPPNANLALGGRGRPASCSIGPGLSGAQRCGSLATTWKQFSTAWPLAGRAIPYCQPLFSHYGKIPVKASVFLSVRIMLMLDFTCT